MPSSHRLLHATTDIRFVAFLIVLCGCDSGGDKASPAAGDKAPPAAADKASPGADPVAEFTEILEGIEDRRPKGIGYIINYSQVSNGENTPYYRFEERYSQPKFDVVKTNSLVSPYRATVTMVETTFLMKCDSEIKAKEAVLSAAALASDNTSSLIDGWDIQPGKLKEYTFNYVNNKWVMDEEFFPFTNRHETDYHKTPAIRLHPPRD